MNDFAVIREERKKGINNGINLKSYIDENRDTIDRISIDRGKVSYDLSQSKMINDVLGISGNAVKEVGTWVKGTLWDSPIEYDPSLSLKESLSKTHEQMIQRDKELSETARPFREKAKAYRDSIDSELSNETSATQSFVAGMAIHTLRQGLDIRQWPGLYVSSLTGGIAGQVAGKSLSFLSPGMAERIGAGIGRFAEEFGEELTDQYTNDGELDFASATMSGLGAVAIGEMPALFKSGGRRISKLIGLEKAEIKANTETADTGKAIKQGEADYVKQATETGSEAKVNLNDVESIAKNTEVHAVTKGKNVTADSVIKRAVKIEGTTVKTAGEEYLPRIVKHIISTKTIKGVKTEKEFLKVLKENPKKIKEVFRKISRKKDLPEDVREATDWYNRVLDEKRIKDVEIDAKATIEASIGELEGKQKYEPIYQEKKVIEKGYPFEEAEINTAEFSERVKEKVKHNSRDYKRKVLEADLVKDLNIPKGAKVLKCNGSIPKTKVPIITGTDYDGNAVTGRSKWIRHTPEADIEYEYNGYRYYAKVGMIDGKWRGDIYKTKIGEKIEAKTETPKVEVKQAENIMEDIHGTYDSEQMKRELWNEAKEFVARHLGLNKEVTKDLYPKGLNAVNKKVMAKVGEVIRKKYKINSLEEMLEGYKKVYGIDFEFKKVKSFSDDVTLGRASKWTKQSTGEIVKIELAMLDGIDDLDLQLGVARHEIQHILDYYKHPEFQASYRTSKPIKDGETIIEFFDEFGKGHFFGHENDWWEVSYLANHVINDLLDSGKINKTSAKTLGLDMIPDKLDSNDIKFIQKTIEEGKGEEAAKRLKTLKTQLSNYFTIKRGLKDILHSEYSAHQKAALAKEYLRTNILLPFQNAEEQMKNAILKAFEIEYNGNILNPEKVLDLFEENEGNLVDVLFYGGKLPDNLKPLAPKIDELRNTLNRIIDELQDKSIASRDDIINTLCYDRNLTIERLMPDEEVLKYIDSNKNLDVEKLANGKSVKDPLTGKDVPERIMPFREKFAELNYKHFNSAVDRLHHEFNRKKLNPERIVRAIKEARECMTLKDFENTLRKYKAEEIPEVREFLEGHKKLFQEIENQDIEGNIIKSKKDNAKRFFIADMQSKKGTEENVALGTFAHKLSRFVDAEYEGYISHQNVSNFVRANKADQRLIISKFVRDVSASHAIKETFPKMGNTGFNVMFKTMQKESGNSNAKTFVKELQNFIEAELGEKLGLETKPARGNLDKIIQGFIKYQNKINLSGPKAIKELGQEPLSMARAQVMLYGGKGFIETYSKILKATAVLMQHGEELSKYNAVLGSKWKNTVPLEFFNIIQDDLNDFTGYRKARVEKYGTRGEKMFSKIDQGLDKVNMYSHTQRVMKLAAYILSGDTMDNLTNAKNLEELFSKNTHYVKRLFKDLEINDVEYTLIKNFKETKSFKELGVFDEVEFLDSLTPEKYSELLGREITEEEFKVLSEATTKKAKRLYEKIVSDVSPTETTGATRAVIEGIEDPIRRNFMRLMGNFKNSIQEQWRRAARDYYLSNISADTGKFDWSNKVWQKRLMSHILGTGMAVAVISTVSDKDFYVDPIETISDKIDNLIDEPGGALWGAVSDNFNLWGIQTGSNVVRRPIAVAVQVSKGEWGKAANTLLKMGIGTTNYDIGKFIYDESR